MEIALSYLQSGISAFIPFVLLLGILIFVHELGHFAVAKFYGVRVEVFSLGFGKKIFQFKKGDTVYCLSLFPLGGYVKMFGDEPGSQPSEDQKKYSFTHKPVGQRIAVVLAGPLMNLFFAVFLYFLLSFIGEPTKAPVVGDVEIGTQAYLKGFRSGDTILKVNGVSIRSWDEFQNTIGDLHDQEVAILVKDESNLEKTLLATPTLRPNENVLKLRKTVGVIPGLSQQAEASLIGVIPGSLVAMQGFKTGDLITKINGLEVKYYRSLEDIFKSNIGNTLSVDLKRFSIDSKAQPEDLTITFVVPPLTKLSEIGIESSEFYLARIIEDSPAAKAGLLVGDRVTQLEGQPVTGWKDLLNYVKNYDEKEPLNFQVTRGTELLSFSITPQVTSQMTQQGTEDRRYTIGVAPYVQWAAPVVVKLTNYNPIEAFTGAVVRTYEITSMTVVSFLRLIQGVISPKTIGGVITIGQVASDSFSMGIGYFIGMMAILSVNLFILNLLPIPVLDGGHLVFYTLEAIKGRPVSLRKMEIAQTVGLALLLSLMVFALFNDVTRIFGS